jgi:hypothetical protein
MTTPFDFVKEILTGNNNSFYNDDTKDGYNSFIINRSLTSHVDTILYANEMNMRPNMDNKMAFDFYKNTIRSKRRPFVKWLSRDKNDDIKCVKEYYKYSTAKALETIKLLSEDELNYIKRQIDPGGSGNENEH